MLSLDLVSNSLLISPATISLLLRCSQTAKIQQQWAFLFVQSRHVMELLAVFRAGTGTGGSAS
jgi:hypothetical protein